MGGSGEGHSGGEGGDKLTTSWGRKGSSCRRTSSPTTPPMGVALSRETTSSWVRPFRSTPFTWADPTPPTEPVGFRKIRGCKTHKPRGSSNPVLGGHNPGFLSNQKVGAQVKHGWTENLATGFLPQIQMKAAAWQERRPLVATIVVRKGRPRPPTTTSPAGKPTSSLCVIVLKRFAA